MSRRPRSGLRQSRRGLVLQHRVRRGPTHRGRTPPGCSRALAYARATAFLPETKAHRTAFKEAVFIDATTGEGVWLRPVVATGRVGCRAHERLGGNVWGVPFLDPGGGDSAPARESSRRSPCESRSGGFSPAGLGGRRLRRRGRDCASRRARLGVVRRRARPLWPTWRVRRRFAPRSWWSCGKASDELVRGPWWFAC